jgi:hypothetical protein
MGSPIVTTFREVVGIGLILWAAFLATQHEIGIALIVGGFGVVLLELPEKVKAKWKVGPFDINGPIGFVLIGIGVAVSYGNQLFRWPLWILATVVHS